MTLADYLLALGGKRRIWCEHDCATHPCDWAVAQGFADPMARWRGAYASEAGAHALMQDCGGLLAMFEQGFSEAGIPRREGDPLPGDVAVLRLGDEEAGSIFTGERWTFVRERGIGFGLMPQGTVSAVWAVGGGASRHG